MAMKMAVKSMEILPGALPRPGRVPEQRLLSPKTWLRCDGGGVTFLEDSGLFLGFLPRGVYIGEGGGVRGGSGWPHPRSARPRFLPARPRGVATLWPPSSCPSGFWSLPMRKHFK